MTAFLYFPRLFQEILQHLLLLAFLLQSNISFAQNLPIIPDNTTNTQVTQTASGIDQINIATPNSNGLSHNKFSDYNVNDAGQIINNFSGNSTAVVATDIAGFVGSNPNLSNGSARVILNEVTSSNVSKIMGYVEIAGSKADLILANPNGITCAGCGFINTAKLLMVAGSSDFDVNGNLGFDLKAQENPNLYVPIITIDGLGLNVLTVSSTEIIASSIKLISSIYASGDGSLTLMSGEGRYDYNRKIIAGDEVVNNEAVFAIDASNLAKIQSGRIFLIASKQGVGVKMAAEILASKEVNIDVNGDVYYVDISAGEKVDIKSTRKVESISSNSSILAPNIKVQANEFKNLGEVLANNLEIKNSNKFNNYGSVKALELRLSEIGDIDNHNLIYGKNLLNISGNNLSNMGEIFSPQNYTITLTGLLTNSGSISSSGNLNILANNLENNLNAVILAQYNLDFVIANSAINSGNLIAGKNFDFSAASLVNSGVIQLGEDSNFNFNILNNLENSVIYSHKNLSFNLRNSLSNFGEISATNNLDIVGNSAIDNNGNILSNDNSNIAGSVLVNGSNGVIASLNKSLNFILVNDLENHGAIFSGQDLSFRSLSLNNFGNILSGKDFSLNAQSLDNRGLVKSLEKSTINVDVITNRANAIIFSIGNAEIVSNSLTNYGSILSSAKLEIRASNLSNSYEIFAVNNLKATLTNSLDNSGLIKSLTKITILGSADITNSNEILSGADLSITAESLDNLGDIISALKFDILVSGEVKNHALLQSGDSFKINAASLTNYATALILAKNNLEISTPIIINQNTKSAGLEITAGIVSSDGDVILRVDNFNNNSGIVAAKSTSLSTFDAASVIFTNSFGALISTASINLDLGSLDYVITGTVNAGDIDITANNITNHGNVTASNFIKLHASGGDITNGYVANDILNKNVVLQAGSYIDFVAQNNINNYGLISGGSNVGLVATGGDINNYGHGKIKGGSGNLTIAALGGAFNNATVNSVVTANNNAIFNVRDLNNFGEIATANNLTVNAAHDVNNNPTALIWSGRDGVFNVVNNFKNDRAEVYANGNLTMQKFDLSNPLYLAAGNKMESLINKSGRIETGEGNFVINVASLNNSAQAGLTQHIESIFDSGEYAELLYGAVLFNTGRLVYSIGGDANNIKTPTLSSGNLLTLNINDLNNNAGSIYSKGNMLIKVNGNISNTGDQFLIGTKTLWMIGDDWPYENWDRYRYAFVLSDETQSYSYPSLIKSQGSLTIMQNGSSASSLINGVNVAQHVQVGDSNRPNHSSTIVNGIDPYVLGELGVVNVDLSGIQNAINSALNLEANTNADINPSSLSPSTPNTIFSGSFTINLGGSPSQPLLESRSQFTDLSKFYGSVDYFNQMGLSGAEVLANIDRQTRRVEATRMLGDSFVETKLILDQLKNISNNSLFISQNAVDYNAQIKELLDNSISEFARLGLGVEDVAINGLGKEQSDSLAKDIIAFETAAINGINVLAPKIHLSLATRNKLLDPNNSSLVYGSTIFAKDSLTINSPFSNLSNSGSIISSGNIDLNIASLTNKNTGFAPTKISAGNNLNIIANFGDIKNIGADIGALGDLNLTALRGNILNSAIVQTTDVNLIASNPEAYQLTYNKYFDDGGLNYRRALTTSSLLQSSSIKGGNINIDAAKDFTNLAAEVSASKNKISDSETTTGNLTITAGDDINIATLEVKNMTLKHTQSKRGETTTISGGTQNLSSNLSAGNNLTLVTRGLTGEGDLDANSNSISISGSNLTADDNLILASKDNLNIESAIDSSYNKSFSTKKGFSSTKQTISMDAITTNAASNLNAGNNLILSSGLDTNIVASNLSAAESGSITTGQYLDLNENSTTYGLVLNNSNTNLNILSGLNTHHHEESSKKLKTGLSLENALTVAAMSAAVVATAGAAAPIVMPSMTATVGVAAAIGSVNQQRFKKSTTGYSEEVVSSNLNFNNNLDLTSTYDITLKSANIDVGNDLNITANHDLNLLTSTQTSYTSTTSTNNGNLFFTNKDYGNYSQEVVNNSINTNSNNSSTTADTGLNLNVGNQIYAEYNSGKTINLDSKPSINLPEISSTHSATQPPIQTNPSFTYLNNLDPTKTIYNPIDEIQKNWSESHSGLTQTGAILVAITATAVTAGTLAPAGTAAGAAAGGAASSTAAAVGASTATAATIGATTATIFNAATMAAITTTAVKTSVSLVNNQGDLGQTLKEVTSKESIKDTLITSAIVAAAAGAIKLSGGTASLEKGKDYTVYKPDPKLMVSDVKYRTFVETNYPNYNGVIDPSVNNIGVANTTSDIGKIGTPVPPYSSNPFTSSFWDGFSKESGFISTNVNKAGGMNSMSTMHDTLTDNIFFEKVPFTTQLSILPAIAVQYCATFPAVCGVTTTGLMNNNFGVKK